MGGAVGAFGLTVAPGTALVRFTTHRCDVDSYRCDSVDAVGAIQLAVGAWALRVLLTTLLAKRQHVRRNLVPLDGLPFDSEVSPIAE